MTSGSSQAYLDRLQAVLEKSKALRLNPYRVTTESIRDHITGVAGLSATIEVVLTGKKSLDAVPKPNLTMLYQFVHVIAGQRGNQEATKKYEARPYSEEDEGVHRNRMNHGSPGDVKQLIPVINETLEEDDLFDGHQIDEV